VTGFAANIYRVAGGNVVVTLVPEGVHEGEPLTAYDVPVTVKLPEAKAIRAAYLLSPDWRGYHKLPLTRKGDTLQLTVPRVRWAGMIVLAKTGVFPALEGPMYVVEGQTAPARYVVDNWTTEPVDADLTLKSGDADAHLQAQINPGASVATAVTLSSGALEASGKLSGGALPPIANWPWTRRLS